MGRLGAGCISGWACWCVQLAVGWAPDFGGPECQKEEETQVTDSWELQKGFESQRGWALGSVIG